MSRNSSVAVLADCTDLYNSHISLIGVNGPSSVLSIENETILTNNTDISPSHVIGSASFQERVRSTDLAALFPRGSLNQKTIKKKKKNKSIESSLSTSQSSENISYYQSNINVSLADKNVSTSFEEDCPENKKKDNIKQSSKPFNKRLYLKKKSVNISFDSGSVNNSISEKSLKRNSRIVNVSFDPSLSKRGDLTETDENVSNSFEASNKIENEKESAQIFKKGSYLRKKSINISFESESPNNSISEKSLKRNRQVVNVSLDPSYSKNRDLTETDENIPDSVDVSRKTENEEESAKIFNKGSYLKRKSVKISFDSSSVDHSISENSLERNSQVVNVTLDPLHCKGRDLTETDENILDSVEVSKKIKNKEESAKIFNKGLYLKKKSVNISFDSGSINNSISEKSLESNSQVVNVSLDPSYSNTGDLMETDDNIPDSVKVSKKMKNEGESVHIPFDSGSVNNSISEKSLERNSQVVNVTLDPSYSKRKDLTETDENIPDSVEVSKKIENEKESVHIPFDSGSVNNSISEKSLERNSQVDNVTLDPSYSKRRDLTETDENIPDSVDVSKKIENEEESAKIFNKWSYLKRKSVNISFDSGSVNNYITEKSLERNNQVVYVSLDPSYSNTGVLMETDKNISDSVVESKKMENEEESAKIRNKELYLRKKSVNISFASGSVNDSISEKSLEKNSQVINVSLDQLHSKRKDLLETDENILESFEVSKKIENEEEPAKIFNKGSYLKKKSVNITFDSGYINRSITEKSTVKNSQVVNVSLEPSYSKRKDLMETSENISDSFEVSKKIENETESPKIFNKGLHLKKKSVNITFGSGSINNSIAEKSPEKNGQVVNVSLEPSYSKNRDLTETDENIPDSVDVSKKTENEEESAKIFNKGSYLKRKSVKISFDSSSVDHSISENSLERNSQVVNVTLDPLHCKGRDLTETDENILDSVEVSKKIENEEECAKIFNKGLYLKRKSVHIDFDSGSVNDSISEKSLEKNSEVINVSLEPSYSKRKDLMETVENISDSFEVSKKIENEEKHAKIFNKGSYLKKKSVNITFGSGSTNNSISEMSRERNSQVVNVSLDPSSSKRKDLMETNEKIMDSFEVSKKMENEEQSAKIFNKGSYLKRKSVKIPFDSSSVDHSISENSLERNSQVVNVTLDPLHCKGRDLTETDENILDSVEVSKKIKNEEESAKIFNKGLYLKKKSVNISFDSGSINNSISEKSLERNSQVVNVSLDPSYSNSGDLMERVENIPDSVEVSKEMENEQESVHIPFDSGSVNNSISEKSIERNSQVVNVTLDSSYSKRKDLTETDENIPDSVEVSKKMENEKESVHIPFDSGSVNHSISEKSIERNSQVVNVTLDSSYSKKRNLTETGENTPDSVEVSKKMENEKESVHIPFDSGSVNNSISEKSIERNSQVVNVTLDSSYSKRRDLTETGENTPDSVEVSKKMENGEESVHIAFDSGSINNSISEKILERNSQVVNVTLDPSYSKRKDLTETGENIPDSVEVSKKMENGEESVHIPFVSGSVNNSISEKSLERNSQVVNVALDPSYSKRRDLTETGENIPDSVEVSKKMENGEESVHIPFDLGSVNNSISEKSLERNSQVVNVTLDPLQCKGTDLSETDENIPDYVDVSKKIENEEESAKIFNKESYLKKKSVNISFDSGSVNNSISEKSLENSENMNISLQSKTKNASESLKLNSVLDIDGLELDECSEENNKKKKTKSSSESNDISHSKINEESNENQLKSTEGLNKSRTISTEENSSNKNTSKHNSPIKDYHSSLMDNSKHLLNYESNTCLNPFPNNQEQYEEVVLSKKLNKISKSENTEEVGILNIKAVVNKSNLCKPSLDPLDTKIINTLESAENVLKNSSDNTNCTSNGNGNSSNGALINSSPPISPDKNSSNNITTERSSKKKNKNLDMRMSVGLSVICKDNEKMSERHTVKKICHSTPLVKYQKNKITNKNKSIPEEVKSDSNHVFTCPDIPARNLRERSINNKSLNISKRSRKDTSYQTDDLENSAKKNKTSPSGNGTEDFIEDISIIPNPKPVTRSRVMYHSTPISKGFVKKNRSKLRRSSDVKVEENGRNIQQDDKMIQVSKSIFGSSTEVTNATVSKKRSIEFSNNSSNGKSDNRTKRKSDSHLTGIKKLAKMESIKESISESIVESNSKSFGESRSYHSNFLSTFEDDNSYRTTRKSLKRVAFKSISSHEQSSSGYGNSSDEYASRNRKSVGFRDAISLIEDTVGTASERDIIRDADNSNFSIVDPNSIGIHDTPGTVNDSKNKIDRTELSLNYSAEVPEIILTENEIESNEMSKECSLFNRLMQMAERKKSDGNSRQNKLSKGRKKLRSSNSVKSSSMPEPPRIEKWVSSNLIKFLNNKLMSDALDHVINTERIVSILCSAVSAVRNLEDVNDIDFALLPLKNILLKFRVCCNMIEYCTFISRFTPFEFQRKALPLEGYFGSYRRGIKKILTDPILTETEKMSIFL